MGKGYVCPKKKKKNDKGFFLGGGAVEEWWCHPDLNFTTRPAHVRKTKLWLEEHV